MNDQKIDVNDLKQKLSKVKTFKDLQEEIQNLTCTIYDDLNEAVDSIYQFGNHTFRWDMWTFYVMNNINKNYFLQEVQIEIVKGSKPDEPPRYRIELDDVATFQNIKKVNLTVKHWEEKDKHESNLLIKNNNASIIVNTADDKKLREKLLQILKDAALKKNAFNYKSFSAFNDFIDLIPETKKDVILVSGFYNGEHVDYRKYKNIYTEKRENDDGSIETLWKSVNPTKEYLDFLNFEYDPQIISEIIYSINNEIARTSDKGFDERIYIKMMIAWAISGIAKYELKKYKIKIFPIMYLVGAKNTGKSHRAKMFFSNMWNSPMRQNDNLKGRAGARLGDLNYDTFPIFFDEVTSLAHEDSFKNALTTGLLKFSKGLKNGGHYDIKIFKPLAICANHFLLKDPAFKDRITFLNYNGFDTNNTKGDALNFLEDNIIHLGKYIYEKLKDFDTVKILDQIKKKHDKLLQGGRDLGKLYYYEYGFHICNELGILNDVEIKPEYILETNADQVIDNWEAMRVMINELIADLKVKENMGEVSVNDILNRKRISYDQFNKFADKGIYFNVSFDKIYLTSSILSKLNPKLKKEGYQIFKSFTNFCNEFKELDLKTRVVATPHYDSETTMGALTKSKDFKDRVKAAEWNYFYD